MHPFRLPLCGYEQESLLFKPFYNLQLHTLNIVQLNLFTK